MLSRPSRSAASKNQTFAADALHPQSLLFYSPEKTPCASTQQHLFLSRALLFYAKSLLWQIETMREWEIRQCRVAFWQHVDFSRHIFPRAAQKALSGLDFYTMGLMGTSFKHRICIKKIYKTAHYSHPAFCLAWHPFSFKFCEARSKLKPIKVVTYTAKCTQPIDGGGSVSIKLIIQSNQIALANFWSHFAPARVSTKTASFKSASSVWLSARVRISKFAGPRVCDSVQTQTNRWKCAIESKIIPAESCKCCGHLRTNARLCMRRRTPNDKMFALYVIAITGCNAWPACDASGQIMQSDTAKFAYSWTHKK